MVASPEHPHTAHERKLEARNDITSPAQYFGSVQTAKYQQNHPHCNNSANLKPHTCRHAERVHGACGLGQASCCAAREARSPAWRGRRLSERRLCLQGLCRVYSAPFNDMHCRRTGLRSPRTIAPCVLRRPRSFRRPQWHARTPSRPEHARQVDMHMATDGTSVKGVGMSSARVGAPSSFSIVVTACRPMRASEHWCCFNLQRDRDRVA